MRNSRAFTAALLLIVAANCGAPPAVVTVNDFGDAGPGNCATTCTLRDAIAVALASVPVKAVTFSDAGGWPQTITLIDSELVISNTSGSTLYVLGPSARLLSVSANNGKRVLSVVNGSNVVDDITLRDGALTGYAAGNGTPGTGESGGSGGTTFGGCVYVGATADLTLDGVDVRNCALTGGRGGDGGSGVDNSFPNPGGDGGGGGNGGSAIGGAIYVAGSLTLTHSDVVLSSATGGRGGDGGDGGTGFLFAGAGGSAGTAGAASGGAIAVAAGALLVVNSTIAGGVATGGEGANGGNGDSVQGSGGNGGDGGDAAGGLIQVGGSATFVDIEFATLAGGVVAPGTGGSPGSVGSPAGIPGAPGSAAGANVSAAASVQVLSSVVVGSGSAGSLCAGNVAAASESVNLDEDSSCSGFTLHDTLAHAFKPFDPAASWPAYTPNFGGAVIDAAASCTAIVAETIVVLADDQHRLARPVGVHCDLGAIESDYIFANPFE